MERRGQQDIALKEATPTGLSTGIRVSPAFARLKLATKNGGEGIVFNNLLHQIDLSLLRSAYHSIKDKSASGTDGITKKRYGENLESNLMQLLTKLHTGKYRTSPSRLVQIPKGDGRLRPIAISNTEDKIVQRAVAFILEVIYEPIFSDVSLGFRPNRGCHDAVQKAYHLLKDGRRSIVLDADMEKFFNSISHEKLMSLLKKRISDRRFLYLIGKLIRTSVRLDGVETANETGSPQGSVVSPLLANIYLHYILDTWFVENVENHYCKMVRYADDVIFCFKDRKVAESFLLSLKERLLMYGLRLNESKTKIIDFKAGKQTVFNFLGFTFYWKQVRKGNIRLNLRTQTERLKSKILDFKLWIRCYRNRLNVKELWNIAARKLRGHYAYYSITLNGKTWLYYISCIKLLFKWLNRRSQKRSFSWDTFNRRLHRFPLPKPYLAVRHILDQDVFDFAV